MSFANPKMLWLGLAAAVLLGWFLWWTWRKRQAVIREFVQNRLLAELSVGVSTGKQKLRSVLLFIAVLLILLTLARPQWGFTWEEATLRGRDIIVAIDTSRSMLAQDLQPNRLARAKLAALDLIELGKYDRLGVIAFAGSAFLQCPLTLDDEAYRQSVQILEVGIIPQGGTAIGEALTTASEAFDEDEAQNHKILILFTDGEDHEEGVLETASKVAGEGMKIFTVGVGTPAGELLRIPDESGNFSYLKDNAGNVVQSRLDEQLLRQIATEGNGFYLPLRGGNAMEILYQQGLEPLPTTEHTTKLMKKLKEQFYWPLGLGVLLLIAELFLPDRKRAPRPADAPAVASSTAALLFLGLLLSSFSIMASPGSALNHYREGNYKSALTEYQRLIEKDPADTRLRYNAGSSAYQAKSFDEAIKQFQAAAAAPDLSLQQQAFYNLANSEFRLGEEAANPQEKIALWEQAIQHYDAALKLNATDADAKFNRELVQARVEELKKQQQQQQKQDQKQDNKDENKDGQKDQQQENKDQQQEKDDQQKQEQQDNQQQQQNKQQQDQQKQSDEQRKQEQQQASNQDGQEQESEQPKQSGGEKEGEQNPEDAQAAEYAQMGKMTPAQAKQLLDAQKSDEKALIFIPQERKSSAQQRTFKDW